MKTVPKAMAILNDPQQPTKRDSSKIEGIDEREESPKSRAKTAPATQPKATPAIRSISTLEEQGKISTVLNDFFKNEVRALQSRNIDALDEYMEEKVNQQGELQKELEKFINHHQSLATDVFVRNRSFLEQELKDKVEQPLKDEIEQLLKSKLDDEVKRLEYEHNTKSDKLRTIITKIPSKTSKLDEITAQIVELPIGDTKTKLEREKEKIEKLLEK